MSSHADDHPKPQPAHDAETVVPQFDAAAPGGGDAAISEHPGSRIGPYKLVQLIGEGGFGTVFAAEQESPVVRMVALKVIKLGMDTRQVVARFEQERQALAMMDHPGIAKVLDAGATASGRPYFVMELVRGEPITDYCDKQSLSTRERLGLFREVCLAVQHAHTKGIIHRDIKPSNVLVTTVDGRPAPKVIDFGIAKATSARLTQHTLFTEQRTLIGTPEYMSPEQADATGLGGVDIDARSDIYSLGVLLYELLTGATPFDSRQLRSAALAEIQRILREVEPPKPSTRVGTLGDRLTSVASRRRTEARRLSSIIRGELDWIVMRAMEKDRTRRYDTAAALAAEIGRYLSNEPVEAGPPSAVYRLRKFTKRNRAGVAFAAGAVLLLVGATGFSAYHAVKARRAEAEAQRAAAKAIAVAEFLREVLGAADPAQTQGHEVTVREAMRKATEKLSGQAMADQPLIRAALLERVGSTSFQLGDIDQAAKLLTEAEQIAVAQLGAEHSETLAVQAQLAQVLIAKGQHSAAKTLLESVIRSRQRTLGAAAPETIRARVLHAQIAQDEEKLEEAEGLLREIVRDASERLGAEDHVSLEAQCNLADLLQDLGKLDEAGKVAASAAEASERRYGASEPLTLTAQSIRASVLYNLGKYAESEEIARRVLETKTRVFGADHRESLTSGNVLALTLEKTGKHEEAIKLLEGMVAAATKVYGLDHDVTVTYRSNLARALQLAGRLDDAERVFGEVMEASRRTRGEDDQGTLIVQNNLALLMLDRGKPAEAEPLFRATLAGLTKLLPPEHWMLGASKGNLGDCLLDERKFVEAEDYLLQAYRDLKSALGEQHDRTRAQAKRLGELYEAWEAAEPGKGRGAQAERWRGLAVPVEPPK